MKRRNFLKALMAVPSGVALAKAADSVWLHNKPLQESDGWGLSIPEIYEQQQNELTESLADIIYNISPVDSPFTSLAKKTDGVAPEWIYGDLES